MINTKIIFLLLYSNKNCIENKKLLILFSINYIFFISFVLFFNLFYSINEYLFLPKMIPITL